MLDLLLLWYIHNFRPKGAYIDKALTFMQKYHKYLRYAVRIKITHVFPAEQPRHLLESLKTLTGRIAELGELPPKTTSAKECNLDSWLSDEMTIYAFIVELSATYRTLQSTYGKLSDGIDKHHYEKTIQAIEEDIYQLCVVICKGIQTED